MRNFFARIISAVMPTKSSRRSVRNCLTYGFGKTRYHGGKNNKIVYFDKNKKKHTVRRLPGCNICFFGDNNYVEIHGPLNALLLNAKLCGNSKIVIQPSKYELRNINIDTMTNCTLEIEADFYVNGKLNIEFCDNTKVHIGQDCMFSYGILIRTGDGHKITTLKSSKRINPNQDVFIGNHVWIAGNAVILKGAYIPDNTIVGAASLVNKKFTTKNTVVAGIPADVKKRGVKWER